MDSQPLEMNDNQCQGQASARESLTRPRREVSTRYLTRAILSLNSARPWQQQRKPAPLYTAAVNTMRREFGARMSPRMSPRAKKTISKATPSETNCHSKEKGSAKSQNNVNTIGGNGLAKNSTEIPQNFNYQVEDEEIVKYADNYLYSIAPLSVMKDLEGPGLNYRTLIGNHEISLLYNETFYNGVIRQAWNQSFRKVVLARLNRFLIITSSIDVLLYKLAEDQRKHVIFYGCDTLELFKITKDLGLNLSTTDVLSVAFVRCDFGAPEEAIEMLAFWLATRGLRALSFSNCTFQDGFTDECMDELVSMLDFRRIKIKRLDIQTTCMNRDSKLTEQLCRHLENLVSLSQRHKCVCPQQNCQSGDVPPNIARIIQSRGGWKELEFDMSCIADDELAVIFASLTTSSKLATLSVNLKHFDESTKPIYEAFFTTAYSLSTLELRGGDNNYYPKFSNSLDGTVRGNNDYPTLDQTGDEVKKFLRLLSPIHKFINHISILDFQLNPRHTKKMILCESIAEFEFLESLYMSDCEFFDINESLTTFIVTRRGPEEMEYVGSHPPIFPPHLTQLELRGLKIVDWKMVGMIADWLPWLIKLDISGINCRLHPKGARDSDCSADVFENGKRVLHPVQLLFIKLTLLQELLMDDLDINDETLFLGLKMEQSTFWMRNRNAETTYPTLADLKDLVKLSLKRTNVSNITVRCIGRHMKLVQLLNVSYTRANEIGISNARMNNPMLTVIAEGCSIPAIQQFQFRSIRWGQNITAPPPMNINSIIDRFVSGNQNSANKKQGNNSTRVQNPKKPARKKR